MLRKMTLASAILFTSVCTAGAQNASKNWLFGHRARVDFNTSTPTATTVNTISTNEGSSSISDANGNLLFYTDGVRVWNKNSIQMPNGFGLLGSASSTQSALIVPCNCNKYYIFTTDAAENQYANGLSYSVVDMTLNGGLGDVVIQNVVLLPKAAEKIAAVRDSGGNGFWVVAHAMGSNRFFSYHVTPNSDCKLNPQAARISAVGSSYSGSGGGNFGQGQMKISPDGTRLAHAGLSYGPGSFVELFQFDTTTGAVSNLAAATVRDTSTSSGFYGIEFSPDSKVLFATTTVGTNFLYRYDITSNTLGVRSTLHTFGSSNYLAGALQLAPDGRIYLARNSNAFLNVLTTPSVNSPNGGWTTAPFNLAAGSSSRLGLPAVVAGNFSCGPTPDVCCDKMRVSPHPNPPLNQDYRTFEIFNFKQPASPICSIDIDMQPAPHTVTWQGGVATWLNSLGNPFAANFVFNYKRLPTAGNIAAFSVPVSSAAVKFNLGFDNTQAYNGVTKLIVNHCDGTKCPLEYGPWVVTPRRVRGDSGELVPWGVEVRELSAELSEVTLTYLGARSAGLPREVKGAKWLGLRLPDGGAEIYALDGAGAADERGRKLGLSSSTKTVNAALFEFAGLLSPSDREQSGRTITLLVRKKGGASVGPKEIRITHYDDNANLIATGTAQP